MLRGHLKHLTLAALREQARSGYDLMHELEERLGNKPSPGSVYPVLAELEKAGHIKVHTKGRRKVYALTAKGRGELASLKALRGKLISQMSESIKLCSMLTGDDMKFHEHILESLSKGEIPFKEVSMELAQFRQVMARLAQCHAIALHKTALAKILKDTNHKIETLLAAKQEHRSGKTNSRRAS